MLKLNVNYNIYCCHTRHTIQPVSFKNTKVYTSLTNDIFLLLKSPFDVYSILILWLNMFTCYIHYYACSNDDILLRDFLELSNHSLLNFFKMLFVFIELDIIESIQEPSFM